MSADFSSLLARVASGASLTRSEAEQAFYHLLSGDVSPVRIAAFLTALRVRGESIEEIAGAVTAMRARMLPVDAPPGAMDLVGTGGDGSGSWNVSTLAAIIVAACGVPVAKHGNKAASSRSGSSDVLGALGVRTGLSPAGVSACLREAGIGFMAAPLHHAAMRHVAPVRAELGFRTIFNILGPLSNPAGVIYQLIGCFSRDLLDPLAHVLHDLGAERVWLVHGSDGLDELTTTGPSHVVALEEGRIHAFTVTPEEAGLARATPEALRGGEPAHNAAALRAVLEGDATFAAYRDIALLNAGAALVVAGRATSLREGVDRARSVLESGAARATLDRLIDVSGREGVHA